MAHVCNIIDIRTGVCVCVCVCVCVSFSNGCNNFKKHLKTHLWLGLSPIDTNTPDGLLMLWNCFNDFAVGHLFGCHSTETGFAGHIGTIECNWLIDWLHQAPPFTRSVPLLRSLHWLPVKYRVHFKICLLTYEAFHEEQPVYLHSLIAISLPSLSLRSNRGITLSVPRIKTNTSAKAFSSCAPSLWNNLPLSVHSATSVATFRRRLKTYLFNLAFPPPVVTSVPNSLLMLQNSFNKFVFEHRSGCCTTEPGYTRDIGVVEI